MVEIYDIHFKDVTVINLILRIGRESHVLVGSGKMCLVFAQQMLPNNLLWYSIRIYSELARMQRMVKDKHSDLVKLEEEFRAYWSPTHSVANLTATQLHNKLDQFKQDLIRIIYSMRCSKPRSKYISNEFYKKWLLGIPFQSLVETPRRKLTSTMQLNAMIPRRSMASPLPVKTSPANRPPSSRQNRMSTISDEPSQEEIVEEVASIQATPVEDKSEIGFESDNGPRIVTRKLLDPKSQLKQNIFHFHQKEFRVL